MSFLESLKLSNLSHQHSAAEDVEVEGTQRRASQLEMFVNARIATFMVNMDAILDTDARMSTFKHNIETIRCMILGDDPAMQDNDGPIKAPERDDASEEKKDDGELA